MFGWFFIRQRRILDQKKDVDEVRLAALEQFIRETTEAAVDSEKKCEEVFWYAFHTKYI